MKPKVIALDHLDATIRQTLKSYAGGKLPLPDGPIINGIIIDRVNLKGQEVAQLAADITAKVKVPAGLTLRPIATPLDKKRILVGFKIGDRVP